MSYALVLGGGGPVGTAWYAGLAVGLADGGVDLRDARVIIGTSAGASAGSWLASGQPLDHFMDCAQALTHLDVRTNMIDGKVLGQVLDLLSERSALTTEDLQHLGTLAREAQARPAADYLRARRSLIPQHSWPSNFHATVIDVDSGELVLLGPDHGIPLEEGVAASGAPAGIIEPFHIGDRWFMDGGMRSGTNADAAMAFEPGAVLVVAVTDHTIPLVGRLMGACIEREVAALSAAGKRVHVITPNAEDNAAMTPNRLDVTRVPGAIQAGLARGRQLARSPELLSLTQT